MSDTARRPLIAGNWKMNDPGCAGYMRELLSDLDAQGWDAASKEVWICPPFTTLATAVESAGDSGVAIAAQDMHEQASGAFTGEVSAAMLVELGARGAILGHSERRELFGETDERVHAKVEAALGAGLLPIVCVGETDAQREAGEMESKLRRQVEIGLAGIGADSLADIVIAYEPIWAIGTGKNATPQQAQEATSFIRALLENVDANAARSTRILYGGSVKQANAAEILSQPDIDGALVGGASLSPGEFAGIVAAAPASA